MIKPVTLGITGYLSGYLGGQFIQNLIAGIDISALPLNRQFDQPFLWYRLFPNETFPPGILIGLTWVVLPLLILLVFMIATKKWDLNLWQKLSVAALLILFLSLGIIISTKIGGGSNLHNLDMFLISLVIITGAVAPDLLKAIERKKGNIIPSLLIFLCIFFPLTYALQNRERISIPGREDVAEALYALNQQINQRKSEGEILFIDHRQLLTFDIVPQVPLINDYEKKRLMDNAMANDSKYFENFHRDLMNQRFSLIINEPTSIQLLGSDYNFGEENNAYIKWVSQPLICMYEPIFTSIETNVEALTPRITLLDDPACDNFK